VTVCSSLLKSPGLSRILMFPQCLSKPQTTFSQPNLFSGGSKLLLQLRPCWAGQATFQALAQIEMLNLELLHRLGCLGNTFSGRLLALAGGTP
jgi:hypothetical protein